MVNAFLVLAHTDPAAFGRTTAAVSEAGPVFAHIDAKSDEAPFRAVAPRVRFLDERLPIVWGGWNMVEATLRLMRLALEDAEVGRVTLMSGLCYPIVSTETLAGDWAGLEWISAQPTRPENWGDRFLHPRPFPDPTRLAHKVANRLVRHVGPSLDADRELGGAERLRVGSQWWSISRLAAELTLAEAADRGVAYRFFKRVPCPDESYHQTVLGTSLPPERLAWETTYVDWEPGGSHPRPITEAHIREHVTRRRHLFIRKMSSDRSDVYELADELRVHNPGPIGTTRRARA